MRLCIFSCSSRLDLGLGVGMGGDDEVLQDLDLLGLEQRGVDLHPDQLALAVQRQHHEAAAGLPLDAGALHLSLHLGHAALQLLGLLHHAGKILHGSVPSSLNSCSAPSSISAGAGALARGRSHRGDARAGEMLQHLLDVGVIADALDLAGLALAALHPERRCAFVSAQGHDPHAAGPGFQLAHQVLAELLRRGAERIELEMAGTEAHEPHLLGRAHA